MAYEGSYKASHGGIQLGLLEMQAENTKFNAIWSELREAWEKINEVLYHGGVLYVSELI